MAKIMLIDATHPEETRVAVADGRKLEEFDVEIAGRRALKGNIYLAKVTRVEPSLQAAFVEYGGNRHGFLAFSEIHPDYYRIPVADREALLRSAREDDEDGGREAFSGAGDNPPGAYGRADAPSSKEDEPLEADELRALWSEEAENGKADQPENGEDPSPLGEEPEGGTHETQTVQEDVSAPGQMTSPWEGGAAPAALTTPKIELRSERAASLGDTGVEGNQGDGAPIEGSTAAGSSPTTGELGASNEGTGGANGDTGADAELPLAAQAELVEVPVPDEVVEMVGGEEPAQQDDPELDEERARRRRQRNLRRYKIQEVIKRRQILLVQVTKEERGNKGAALTTYLSLAGRYCVLMPNTDRGGGISRRITSANDRKRLKSIIDDLDIPEGMAVIVRTAGMERSKPEISRDFEYLLRLWDEIRETTLQSTAPALIYEEASLIKRSIRDLYTRDIGDIVIAGQDAYQSARAFMRTLTPGHLKRIQLYRDTSVPLFQRYQIEGQIAAIHEPLVQLRSGGYIVINQTEALVAIDVNSGRSTRERNIEETALRTNLEAAEEIARQLRLRDLAGLIVIDFIDMEENRNNSAVERRLKEALKNDRARIQIGRISIFGLLEMSRQRLHPSLVEASTEMCPHCAGAGRVRSVDSTSLHVLRMVEEEITRQHSPGVSVLVPPAVALYILNQKRAALADVESRRGVRIYVQADDSLTPPGFRVDRIKQLNPGEEVVARPLATVAEAPEEEEIAIEEEVAEEAPGAGEGDAQGEELEAEGASSEQRARDGEARHGRRRRRRRGRGGRLRADEFTESERQEAPGASPALESEAPSANVEPEALAEDEEGEEYTESVSDASGAQDAKRRRRRGRRGGRRRQRRGQPDVQDGVLEGAGDDRSEAAPGLGEQPPLPDELPPDWRSANGEPDRVPDAGREAPPTIRPEASAEQRGETARPRRTRKPRRQDIEIVDLDIAPTIEPREAPPRPTAAPSSPAPEKLDRPVQIIEIREAGPTAAVNEEEGRDAGEKKRGWWRRLIE